MDKIVGIMWARNEADIIAQTIEDALKKVDCLLIADDDSTDGTWEIMQSFGKRLEYIAQRQQTPHDLHPRLWGKQHLLEEVRRRFGYKDVWVQVIESDIMLLDSDPREMIKKHAVKDVAVDWHLLNGCRTSWEGEDNWPNWTKPIQEVMPICHWMEIMRYTFRPLPDINFIHDFRPWPRGFHTYDAVEQRRKMDDSPLLIHYGYRGPKHFYEKYKHFGPEHPKYTKWKLTSVESVIKTVSFFNGEWNSKGTFEANREDWKRWLNSRHVPESPI